jgi:hypothetical protein
MGYLPLDDLGSTIFFQLVSAVTSAAAVAVTFVGSQNDAGLDHRRSDHPDGDSRLAPAPFDNDQHPR